MDFSNKRRKCAFPGHVPFRRISSLGWQWLGRQLFVLPSSHRFRGRIFGDWLLILLSDFTSLERKLTYIPVQKIKLDFFGDCNSDDSNTKLLCDSKYQKADQMTSHGLGKKSFQHIQQRKGPFFFLKCINSS